MKDIRSLTTRDAVAITVGTMIGAGIFTVLGLTVRTAGPSALLAWILVVVLSFPMAYTFSDLTGALAESGGPYVYLREKRTWLGLWTAWLFLLSAAGAAIGLYISLIGMLAQLGAPHPGWIGTGILAALAAIVIRGIHLGARVQAWLSGATVLLLGACVAVGLAHAHQFRLLVHPLTRLHIAAAWLPHGSFSMLTATFFAFWTYSGWEAVSVPAGAYASRKQLAHGMMYGSLIVGVLYILVAAAAIFSVPIAALENAVDPLVFVGQLAGPWFGMLVALGAIVVVVSSLLAWLITSAGLLQAAARDGLLPAPRFIRRHTGEYHPLLAAVAAVGIWAISQGPLFTAAVSASSLTALFAYLAIFGAVALDRGADWEGVVKGAARRRALACVSWITTLALVIMSGWSHLWPTLCLTGIGLCIVGTVQWRAQRKLAAE